MRSAWILVWILLTGLQACQPTATTTPTSGGAQEQSLPPSTATGGADVASDIATDATGRKMITLARAHLANKLGLTVEQIALSAIAAVQWRDAGLGCAKPGVDYLPTPTPGYRISLQVGGTTYEYHADDGNRVILCATTQA